MSLAVSPHMQVPEVSLNERRSSGQEMRQVCEKFEAFFVQEMFKSMRQTIPEGGLIERSNAQSWFEEFMDAEAAQSLAERSDLGIAEAMYREMSAMNSNDMEDQESKGQHVQSQG